MLCLTRKAGEAIVLNEDVRIVVSEIRGTRVAVGIEAPESVPIRRGEQKKAGENRPQDAILAKS